MGMDRTDNLLACICHMAHNMEDVLHLFHIKAISRISPSALEAVVICAGIEYCRLQNILFYFGWIHLLNDKTNMLCIHFVLEGRLAQLVRASC